MACANIATAQVPSPGYAFLEVKDEKDKPVSGAAVVVYDKSGKEIGGWVTDPGGKAPLLRKNRGAERYVLRVIKAGYLTYEGVIETSEQYWRNDEIKIKLVSLSKSKSKGERRPSPLPVRTPSPP